MPEHLVWYILGWALLMSPFYVAAAMFMIFLWRALPILKQIENIEVKQIWQTTVNNASWRFDHKFPDKKE
jgi:hypothetical protein